LIGVISLLILLASTCLIIFIIKPKLLYEYFIWGYVVFVALVIETAYFLADLDLLNSITAWIIVNILVLLLVLIIIWRTPTLHERILQSLIIWRRFEIKNWWAAIRQLSFFRKLVLGLLFFSVALAGMVNLAVAIKVAPVNWDSQTYQLARVGYYLQNGNFENFGANYEAQEIHFKNSTALLAYIFQVTRNENLMQLNQFVAYWITILAVYGITRSTGAGRYFSLVSALLMGTITMFIWQATTTQNDLLLATFVAITIFSLLRFKENKKLKYLILAAIAAGILLGIKSSAYSIGFALKNRLNIFIRNMLVLVGALIICFILFALPAGYAENSKNYGHAIGPVYWRQIHSYVDRPLNYVLWHGTMNFFRFSSDLSTLDSLNVSFLEDLMVKLREEAGNKIYRYTGMDLEDTSETRNPFLFDREKEYGANEDFAYLGVAGVFLAFPSMLVSLFGWGREHPLILRILALAGLIFLVLQSYSGPYDPWRGRYFQVLAVFSVPLIGGTWAYYSFREAPTSTIRRLLQVAVKMYILVVLILSSLTVFNTIYDKTIGFDIFKFSRMEQLTLRRPWILPILESYEKRVPEDAVVISLVGSNFYEYPLFGEGLTRELIPHGLFMRNQKRALERASHLLFHKKTEAQPVDSEDENLILLGDEWGIVEFYLQELE